MVRVGELAWYASTAATACLIVRLVSRRLHRRFGALVLWLGVDLVEQVLRIVFGRVASLRTSAGWVYLWGELIQAIITVFVVREVWTSATSNYKALARVGRWTVVGVFALVVGLAVSPIFSVVLDPSSFGKKIATVFAVRSAADNVAAIFFAVIAGATALFPIVVPRSTVIYIQGMMPFFLGEWLLIWVARTFPSARDGVNVALFTLPFLCRTYWLLAFPSSESDVVAPAVRFHSAARSRELTLRVHRANAFVDQLTRRI